MWVGTSKCQKLEYSAKKERKKDRKEWRRRVDIQEGSKGRHWACHHVPWLFSHWLRYSCSQFADEKLVFYLYIDCTLCSTLQMSVIFWLWWRNTLCMDLHSLEYLVGIWRFTGLQWFLFSIYLIIYKWLFCPQVKVSYMKNIRLLVLFVIATIWVALVHLFGLLQKQLAQLQGKP